MKNPIKKIIIVDFLSTLLDEFHTVYGEEDRIFSSSGDRIHN